MKTNWHILLGLTFLGLTGCSDNLPAVLRDYYNVENEVIDHLVFVCDDATAKHYNELYKNRIKPKEDEVKERLERLNRQQITQTDQKLFAELHKDLEANQLKGEMGGLEGRYRKEQARIRRIIVKLTEDKAEEMKPQDQSFTVEASQLWQNLSSLEPPKRFSGADDGFRPKAEMLGGGPGGGPPPGMMMGGGMPGMGGGPPGMAGGPPGMGGQGGGGAGLFNSNLSFSMQCERIVNAGGQKDWRVTRRWRSGNTVVDKLESNGINLVPHFSDAGGG